MVNMDDFLMGTTSRVYELCTGTEEEDLFDGISEGDLTDSEKELVSQPSW